MRSRHILVVAGVTASALAVGAYIYAPREYTCWICFYCRARREKGTIAGIEYEHVRRSDFCDWYMHRFSGHRHRWWPLGRYRGNALGAARESGGGLLYVANPMWYVTAAEQRVFFETADRETITVFDGLLASNQYKAVNIILAKRAPPETMCAAVCCGKRTRIDRGHAVIDGAGAHVFCSMDCIKRTKDFSDGVELLITKY